MNEIKRKTQIILNELTNKGIKFRIINNDIESLPSFSRRFDIVFNCISQIKILEFSPSKKTATIEIEYFSDETKNTTIEKLVRTDAIEHFILVAIIHGYRGGNYNKSFRIKHIEQRNIKLKK